MKIIQKYLSVIAITVVLFCIAVSFSQKADISLPRFLIPGPEGAPMQEVSVFNAGDGNYYVFLPSYADMDQVIVTHDRNHLFSLEDIPLEEGMNCEPFHGETPYSFSVDQEKIGALWFFQSANVATMDMETVSGDLQYIHQDKTYKETVSMTLYTPDGRVNHSDTRGTLNGRGNMTWNYDKRPYTLTLSSDAALLDMHPASKWILLANAADETNLNNKIVFDLAQDLDLQWTPQCQWTDLYINGEYRGLYLLTEKVEVQENRLALDIPSGDFLCKIDLEERWATMQNPFFTDIGRTVEICAPAIPGAAELDRMENLVNRMEQEILSGTNLRSSTILDLDSWVYRYLFDEVFANIDSDLASCFFYYSDGTFFAGPLWDYDMTLGNYPRNQDPHSFLAKNHRKSQFFLSPYYDALYHNASFYQRMCELYRTEFVPELQNLLDGKIDAYIDYLADTSRANSLRWRSMYDNLPADVVHTPDALKTYLAERVRFLDSAWLDSTVYCTVQFESAPGSSYKSTSVRKGQILETPYIDTESTVWFDAATGEVFDFRQPVTSDRILVKEPLETQQQTANADTSADALSLADIFIGITSFTLLTVFLWVAVADRRLRKQDGKRSMDTNNQ